MRVREVMTKQVETIGPDEPLRIAAERMRACAVGSLVVVQGTELLGIVTDRDITVRATAQGLDPNTTSVRVAMTCSVVTCGPEALLAEAERLMEEKAVRRLVVVNTEEWPIGILSLDDLATVPQEAFRAAEVLTSLNS